MSYGANRNEAALAVEQAAEDAGRVEAWNAEPVDRAVGRDERARVAVGQERVVRDRGERGRRCRALRQPRRLCRGLAHGAIQGSCQRPWPGDELLAASSGPQEPGRVGCTGGGLSRRGCIIRHVSSTRVLAGEAKHVCRRSPRGGAPRTASALPLPRRRTPCRSWIGPGPVFAVRLDDEPHAGRGVELEDQLVRHDLPLERGETQLRRMLEDEPKLRLGDGKPLAGPDVEGNACPAPVLDVEPERCIGLGRRVGRNARRCRGSRRTGRGRSWRDPRA